LTDQESGRGEGHNFISLFLKNFRRNSPELQPRVVDLKKSLTFAVLLKTDEIQP